MFILGLTGMKMKIINPVLLLTDFGTKDPYVTVMKGVILSKNREAVVIDASHEITPQNVQEASFFLIDIFDYYPKGSVFVCVVDPGVGSQRKILVAKIKDKVIIAPDNGLLSSCITNYEVEELFEIDFSSSCFSLSSTFHGRDIFAPVAADLSMGIWNKEYLIQTDLSKIKIEDYSKPLVYKKNRIEGRVLKTDGFGNIITNIKKGFAESYFKNLEFAEVYVGDYKVGKIHYTYADADLNCAAALWNSSDYLEIAVPGGSALKRFPDCLSCSIYLYKN